MYYGGGGQGNHLYGAYGAALHKGFGGKYRSSAVGQEKSGEIWVNGVMFGNAVRGEFDECEVAVFVGKNPWMSHSIPHTRTTLKAIANDENRSMVGNRGCATTPTDSMPSGRASPRSTSPSTARSLGSRRTSCDGRRDASPRGRASPCSRTSS